MLRINDLKNGKIVLIDGTPYQIIEAKHLHMGRGGSSLQTKIRNLKTGQVVQRNFKPSDMFEEADIQKEKIVFAYAHRGEFIFVKKDNPRERFSLQEENLSEIKKWLKPNTEVDAVYFDDEIMNITVPIKMDFRVIESPPGRRGDTANAGTKTVTVETGAKISTPLFIDEDDVISVNTETGEYVERVEKAK